MDITHLEGTDVTGNEALSLSERIKLFYSDISLSIDKFNAAHFNASIHTVETNKILDILKDKNNYFNYSFNQIPTPVFFNPKKISFKNYVILVTQTVDLLKLTNAHLDKIYKIVKQTAAKSELPFSAKNTDDLKLYKKLKTELETTLQNSGIYTRAINQVYPNINDAVETYKLFNNAVKNIKSRDIEITAKQVDNLVALFKILRTKIDNDDVTISVNEKEILYGLIDTTNDVVKTLGQYFTLLNELTRTLELQIDEFTRYV